MDKNLTEVKDKEDEIADLRRQLDEKSRELTLALQAARDAEKAKSDFFSKMSFEIRTPLSAIINSAFLGPLQLEEGNTEKVNYYFDIIHQYGTDLLEVVNKYLDLTTLESGVHSTNLYVVDIHPYIDSLVEKYRSDLEEKNQHVDLKTYINDTMLEIDKDLFDKLFFQILHNAKVYSPVDSTIKIEIIEGKLDDEEDRKDYLLISIQDQGPGIPQGEVESIFGKFYQSSVVKTDIEGIGIGLSICKNIMKKHGGKIWVESAKGKGSKFICAFPRNRGSNIK